MTQDVQGTIGREPLTSIPDPAPSSIGHVPATDKWAFDDGVAQVFDDMLQRSIPAYASMRELVDAFAAAHVDPHGSGNGHVVDLGCSRGAAVASLIAAHRHALFTLTDVSEPMLEAARARFSGRQNVRVWRHDLRDGFPVAARTATLILSVLTLQFTPLEHRLRIVRDAYKALVPRGAFILVEKVIGATADMDAMFVAKYYGHKREMGYSQDEIDRKRLSLEGVLVPLTARWNEELLRGAGFQSVDCFWRWANFAGWIAVKEA